MKTERTNQRIKTRTGERAGTAFVNRSGERVVVRKVVGISIIPVEMFPGEAPAGYGFTRVMLAGVAIIGGNRRSVQGWSHGPAGEWNVRTWTDVGMARDEAPD